jgi:hypothetical protein
MGNTRIGIILAILLAALALPGNAAATGVLESRLAAWPDWRLPAPLTAPAREDLRYPAWFAGEWQVTADMPPVAGEPPSGEPLLHYLVRFGSDGRGAVVGDRAANAAAVGRALLGDQLLEVRDDPSNPNRQLARLAGGGLLESTVVARRSEVVGEDGQGSDPPTDAVPQFLADELAMQVLHGAGEPRISRIETLSRFRLRHGPAGDWIEADQWQARYPSPTEGLAARSLGGGHWRLRLDPLRPESGRAS